MVEAQGVMGALQLNKKQLKKPFENHFHHRKMCHISTDFLFFRTASCSMEKWVTEAEIRESIFISHQGLICLE